MSSIITIAQQIEELRLELAHCNLTKRERRDAINELDWLKEQQRINEEATYFASIEREAEHMPQHRELRFDALRF
jgi:hypothetical protein